MVVTRFAPSPTGDLHLGSVRAALFAWLFAKHHNGTFRLRIEDTDQERSTEASTHVILEGLAWLGLDFEDPVVYQSQRFDHYRTLIQQLLDEGKAYRCACSTERLDTLRATQQANKEKPRYDGHCREKNVDPNAPHVIRLKRPLTGSVTFDDAVHGTITVDNSELDDWILLRTDGSPTYNFTVVVDDHDMGMTHVIRGDDHINNTPKQCHVYDALNYPIPTFAHLPIVLGSDGAKLSKRHGALSILKYREEGFLPQTMLNYLVRLGWAHKDQEIFSRAEMMALFTLDHVQKSPAGFDPQKLLWLNQHYLKTTDEAEVAKALQPHLDAAQYDSRLCQDPILIVQAFKERVKTLKEMAEKAAFLFTDTVTFDPEAKAQHLTEAAKPILDSLHQSLSALTTWDVASIKSLIKATAKEHGVKMPQVAQPLRVALTGNTQSPSIDLTLAMFGQERALERLENACKAIDRV